MTASMGSKCIDIQGLDYRDNPTSHYVDIITLEYSDCTDIQLEIKLTINPA